MWRRGGKRLRDLALAWRRVSDREHALRQYRPREPEAGDWLDVDRAAAAADGGGTEAKYLVLRDAFETLGAMRAELKTDSLNEWSRRAILRLGAVEEGTFRKHMTTESGRVRHTVYFSVIDEEWAGWVEGMGVGASDQWTFSEIFLSPSAVLELLSESFAITVYATSVSAAKSAGTVTSSLILPSGDGLSLMG
jgi:hypothetical protein